MALVFVRDYKFTVGMMCALAVTFLLAPRGRIMSAYLMAMGVVGMMTKYASTMLKMSEDAEDAASEADKEACESGAALANKYFVGSGAAWIIISALWDVVFAPYRRLDSVAIGATIMLAGSFWMVPDFNDELAKIARRA